MSAKLIKEREPELLAPGHRACPGCGTAIAVRLILKATGRDVILVSPTGCLETFASRYLESPWEVPWMHPLFENAAAVASGIEAALRVKGSSTKVVVIAGDGGTYDIGMGGLSGMFERGQDILYICYDNEAYMNTGVQRSASTPYLASTTTSPHGRRAWGEDRPKKDMPAIAAAHGIPYVATASLAYPQDLINKIKKALSTKGPKYIQIDCPCNIGWGFPESKTIEIARLAAQTGLTPLFEMENGQVTKVRKIKDRKPVEEYLEAQSRFRHLFQRKGGAGQIAKIQAIADANARRYGLDS